MLISKAEAQFQKDVDHIRKAAFSPWAASSNEADTDLLAWCDKMNDAIKHRDTAAFNYLAQRLPKYMVHDLHYPDVNMPGLTPADIKDLSEFTRPEVQENEVK
jgi:hypothetical protein